MFKIACLVPGRVLVKLDLTISRQCTLSQKKMIQTHSFLEASLWIGLTFNLRGFFYMISSFFIKKYLCYIAELSSLLCCLKYFVDNYTYPPFPNLNCVNVCTECPKIYRKSVLHLLKYRFAVYISRRSTDLR